MANFKGIPAGSTITKVYLQVPGLYGSGMAEFPDTREGWDAAVLAGRERMQKIVDEIISSYPPNWPGIKDYALKAAVAQVVIDLRWGIDYPDGGGTDMVAERFKVADLRTYSEIGARA